MSELPAPHTWRAPHDPLCPQPAYDHPCIHCQRLRQARADEREEIKYEMGVLQWEGLRLRQERADLRAKVEALPLVTVEGNHPYFGTVYVADVLALIDGSSDE